jgi:hypothetical protein
MFITPSILTERQEARDWHEISEEISAKNVKIIMYIENNINIEAPL